MAGVFQIHQLFFLPTRSIHSRPPFETLRKEFAIRDPKVATIAEVVHDADLDDGKFGRTEGLGLDRGLIGWAKQGVPDQELLRRGMQLIEGLYQSELRR